MKGEVWRPLQVNQIKILKFQLYAAKLPKRYHEKFGQKEFMLHQSKGLPVHPTWNAYIDEELKFLDIVCKVPIHEVPKNSSIITSHVI